MCLYSKKRKSNFTKGDYLMKKLFKMAVGIVMLTSMAMGSAAPAFAAESLQQQVLEQNKEVLATQRIDEAALYFYTAEGGNVFDPWFKSGVVDKNAIFWTSNESTNTNPALTNLAKEITKDAKTDYEKCKAIHDWVCKNIWYDYDAYNYSLKNGGRFPEGFHTGASEVLETRKTVCDGYVNLTNCLLKRVGIPAKKISGYALGLDSQGTWTANIVSGENNMKINHTWTAAYVDGRWLLMDTTWDSQNKYKNGKFGAQKAISNEYFDMDVEKLSRTHKIVSTPDKNLFPPLTAEQLKLAGLDDQNNNVISGNVVQQIEKQKTEEDTMAIVSICF